VVQCLNFFFQISSWVRIKARVQLEKKKKKKKRKG